MTRTGCGYSFGLKGTAFLKAPLVGQGLRALAAATPAPIIAEHSGDHVEGVAALEAAGFRPRRVLLSMRRPIVPADELL